MFFPESPSLRGQDGYYVAGAGGRKKGRQVREEKKNISAVKMLISE